MQEKITMNPYHSTASRLVASLAIEQSAAAQQHLRNAALPGNWSPAAYVSCLLADDLNRDARHFLAHALPRRRALWWACLCSRDVREFAAEAALDPVLEIATEYVRLPSESLRRAAQSLLQTLPLNSLSAHLAAAVFMTAGSLGPPDSPAVPVPPQVLGRLVSTIVYGAATKKNVVQFVHHMREYIELGREIAAGKHLWPQEAEPTYYRLDRSHEEHPRLPALRPLDVQACFCGTAELSAHVQPVSMGVSP
jgi:hypothetical protein